MPRGRPFQYSQEEFLADVFGPDAVPKSKSPTCAPRKAWNAPPLSDHELAKIAERSARVDASKAKVKQQLQQLQQQQQRQPPAESLTEEQQLKAYELKAATLLKAVKSARVGEKEQHTKQQLRRIGLGPFAASNEAKANLAKADLAAAATAAPPPKQKRRTVAALVPAGPAPEEVAAALDIERKASSRASAALEVRSTGCLLHGRQSALPGAM